MINILILFSLLFSTICKADTLIMVDVWGQLAEYGDIDSPPQRNQLNTAPLSLGNSLFKNLICKDCFFVYHSPITTASGSVKKFIAKHELPPGKVIQSSNYGIDYLSIFIDYFLNYKFKLMSTDFDSLFYNFCSTSIWRSYFSIQEELLKKRNKHVIVFTTNHSFGLPFYYNLIKKNQINNYTIFVKDIKGEFLYKKPEINSNIFYYKHEIEILDNIKKISKIKLKSVKDFELAISKNEGLSLSLAPFLIKNADNKQLFKSRKKQVSKKINELYESLKEEFLINSKNLDAVEPDNESK